MDNDPQKRIGELHGKTVAVETKMKQTFVGRCSRFEDGNLIMVDLDHFHGDWNANIERLEGAVSMGHWPAIKKAFIPKADITRMELLVRRPWAESSTPSPEARVSS